MNSFEKYTREVDVTYFKKISKVSIEDIPVGSLVYLKVDSHSKTTIRELEYYGKIVKITPCFFDFLGYCESVWRSNDCETEVLTQRENNPIRYTKKWAKKSIIELWLVDTEHKKETKEYYKSI